VILPKKHLYQNRSLLHVGAELLALLSEPTSVSELWERIRQKSVQDARQQLTFDWFVLSLALLFALGAIELEKGAIRRRVR